MDNNDFTLDPTIDEFLTTQDQQHDTLYNLMVDVWHLPEETLQRIVSLYNFDYPTIHRMINDYMLATNCTPEQIDYTEIFPMLATGGRTARTSSTFEIRPHEYLWNPYVPMDDVTILMASGGTGKTLFCCWLLAQVSKGGWISADHDYTAQHEGIVPEPRKGLIISSEDDGSELRGRLEACGADLSKVYILDKIDSEGMSFTGDGYQEFLQTVKDVNPALLVIDPWQAFIGQDVDVSKVNHVRPAMQKLALIATECHCSIILISHVNKRAQGENLNYAATGSTDFVNAARSALFLSMSDDEEEPDTRILIHSKANYSASGDSLKFDITPFGAFDYRGKSEVTRSMIEEANRTHKSLSELMIIKRNNADTAKLLIEAVCSYAKEGEPVIIAYDQFKDDFGEEIFGGSPRPSLALQKISRKLKERNITLEFKTINGYPKKATYDGKKLNGVEILLTKSKGQA